MRLHGISRRRILAWTAGAGAAASAAPVFAARPLKIVDAARRTVGITVPVSRVFAASPAAAVTLFTIAPELMLGWTNPLRDDERPYVPQRYANLPAFGRLAGPGRSMDLDVLAKLKPDLIFDYGIVNSSYAASANRVQDQLHVPFMLLNGRFGMIPESYRILGAALDRNAVAGSHVAYYWNIVHAIDNGIRRVPKGERPRVYLARGPHGLETGLDGSINTEMIERAGAANAAAGLGKGGVVNVSLAQVAGWDPDMVIAIDPGFHRRVMADPNWKTVKAVREGRVYLSPRLPFGWVDLPPAINRLLGLQWLAKLFYPRRFPDDLAPIIRDFHRRFYHRVPSNAQIARMLQGSLPPR
jgi:iron complex transport system substrate-binding protein